jgi:hypothetical protein
VLALCFLTVGVLGSALVVVHAANASNATRGVKFVHFGSNPVICDGAIPCLPGGGHGKSNTIYISQTEVNGEYRYTDVFGTAQDPDNVWLQTTLEGECASNHRLSRLEISAGYVGDFADQVAEVDTPLAGWPITQPVDPDNKTLPRRNVAVDVPVEQVVDSLMLAAPLDLADWGEQRIADLVADGTPEGEARIAPYSYTSSVGMNATLTCRRRTNHDRHPFATDSTWHTLEIVWLGVGMEPGGEDNDDWRDAVLPEPTPPEPIEPNLSVGFQVTQASLAVVADPADACLIHLSGVVTTTEPGTVSYRFVDEFGQRSQTYAVEVDHTRTTMFSHPFVLEPVTVTPPASHGGPDDLTVADDGEIGGLTQEPTDNVQGYFQLEVVEPHAKSSNIASYNVDGCVEETAAPGDLTTPTPPPAPPGDVTTPPPPPVPPVPTPTPDDLAPPPTPPTPPSPGSDDLAPPPTPPTPPSFTGPGSLAG